MEHKRTQLLHKGASTGKQGDDRQPNLTFQAGRRSSSTLGQTGRGRGRRLRVAHLGRTRDPRGLGFGGFGCRGAFAALP